MLEVPDLVRTPSRTTQRLIDIVGPLTELGITIEAAMVRAAPPFPVAGFSWFTDDWMFPRYVPDPHLHEGTDIFAEAGTPILASGPGVVGAINDTPVGGLNVWVVGDDGNTFYYAHLAGFAEGLVAGNRVDAGTVLGYVGDSGNAYGGSPHVHLEIHAPVLDRKGNIVDSGINIGLTGIARSRTPATNPKPYLDQWLKQAEARADAVVIELLQRFAGLTRQIHFSQKVDSLYPVRTAERPRELLILSPLDPTLATIGLARDSALLAMVDPARTAAIRSLREQELAAIEMAVSATSIKVTALVGNWLYPSYLHRIQGTSE